MHKYAVQITVADVRDGGLLVLDAEGGLLVGQGRRHLGTDGVRRSHHGRPLIASDAWHRGSHKARTKRRWNKLFGK